jgi:hypothetical protein
MSTKQKGQLIAQIITHLEFHAKAQNKAFDAGVTFFRLAFKSDSELAHIAKLAGV